MEHILLRIVIATIFALLTLGCQGNDWQSIQPGLEYRYYSPHLIPTTASSVYAFRIDPNHFQLRLINAKSLGQKAAYVNDFAKKSGALIAVNGGFFSTDKEELGLRVQNGKIISPLRNVSWWGVFYIQNNIPKIAAMKNFHMQNNIEFAIQAGPRLLVNNQQLKLTPGRDLRSALCIDPQNHIIIAVTNNLPLTTNQFASVLQKFGCTDALNLDGGNSAQVYANTGKLHLDIETYRQVADAVGVFPR